MATSIEAIDRILPTARETGIFEEITEFFTRFLQSAKAAGCQNEAMAALIKLLRAPHVSARPGEG